MQNPVKSIHNKRAKAKYCLFVGIFMWLLFLPGLTFSQEGLPGNTKYQDTALVNAINKALNENSINLRYPASVKRFYQSNACTPAWLAPDTIKTHVWDAMLLLDCILQYGLNHSDYHPDELLYEQLHQITDEYAHVSNEKKAAFDIYLTDAMVSFINHLHYGKLNRVYTEAKTDTLTKPDFCADAVLMDALHGANFINVLESVQPKSKAYIDLQKYMKLVTGTLTGDCYEFPERTVKTMAVNMERLRWAGEVTPVNIQINIPSYTLRFYQPDTITEFKVVVGKPATPTPVLQSAISYFTTSPEWKVPANIFIHEILPKAIKDSNYLAAHNFTIYRNDKYIIAGAAKLAQINKSPAGYTARQSKGSDDALGMIVFRFNNPYNVFLHDTPEPLLFKREKRAFSHGCIRVEHPEKLAGSLLTQDGKQTSIPAMLQAIRLHQTKNFSLKRPVAIQTTYLTCEIKEGMLIMYDDVYHLDQNVETSLYNSIKPLAVKL